MRKGLRNAEELFSKKKLLFVSRSEICGQAGKGGSRWSGNRVEPATLTTTGVSNRERFVAPHFVAMPAHAHTTGVRRIGRKGQGSRNKVSQNNAQQNQLCNQTAHYGQQPRSEPQCMEGRTKQDNPSSRLGPRKLLPTCSAPVSPAGETPALPCYAYSNLSAESDAARDFRHPPAHSDEKKAPVMEELGRLSLEDVSDEL